jgi:formylglycine-generating enzyme required for sulfatase activity
MIYRCLLPALALLWPAQHAGAQETAAKGAPPRQVHWAAPEEALAWVEASGGAGAAPRRSAALVLRCDGFLLVPVSAQSAVEGGGDGVTVTLEPGTPREHRVKGRRTRHLLPNVGYCVIKLDDTHAPAARTLLPDTLKPGDPLEVLWPGRDAETGRFTGVQRVRGAVGKAREGDGASADLVTFQEPLEGVPSGAVVIGPDKMVVGMVVASGTAARTEFLSFSVLERVTNCVGAAPTPDSQYRKEQEAAPEKAEDGGPRDTTPRRGRTVRVAGGPVRLHPDVVAVQPDMERAAEACVGDFEIDELEVTNNEYLTFLRSLPPEVWKSPRFRADYWPLGWPGNGQGFQTDTGDLPVIGAPYHGAKEYARSRGKRLPTPYEWLRAAFGPTGDPASLPWIGEYVGHRLAVFQRVRDAHLAYLNANRALLGAWGQRLDKRMPWWAFGESGFPLDFQRFSMRTLQEARMEVRQKWSDPYELGPPGGRPYDVSPFRAMDMMSNAWEWTAAYPTQAAGVVRVVWPPHPAGRGHFGTETTNVLDDPMPWVLLPSWSRLAGVQQRALMGRADLERFLPVYLAASSMDDAVLHAYPVSPPQLMYLTWRTEFFEHLPGIDPVGTTGSYGTGAPLAREWALIAPRQRSLGTPLPDILGAPRPGTAAARAGANMSLLTYVNPIGFRCAR